MSGEKRKMTDSRITRVAIIVLGDLGRSPRMEYHAVAFARSGVSVDVIAFRGKPPIAELTGAPNVRLQLMSPLEISDRFPRLLRPVLALLRLAAHSLLLAVRLFTMPRADVLLVQNPPAFPAVPLALAAGRIRGSRVIVDWHNLTSAMAGLRMRSSTLLKFIRNVEEHAGRRANAGLAVTEELRQHLSERGIENVEVFRDYAWHGDFDGTPASSRPLRWHPAAATDHEVVTAPLTVVTSTSWSNDERLEWLLDAASAADPQLDENSRISILITGDGSRRRAFEARRASMQLHNVEILTTWVDSTVYRATLAQADCGISLHQSASGLDFPMKIADMRGAGLPVLACDSGGPTDRRFRGTGGIRFFSSAAELATQLVAFAKRPELVRELRNEVPAGLPSWTDEWERVALPFMTKRGAA